jgi:ribosomal-protein-alanine N-acetyltransferase
MPEIRLKLLTESLSRSSNDITQFANQCAAQIDLEDLEHVRPMLNQSIEFYSKISAIEPWVGYVAIRAGANGEPAQVIGCCGFKGNPNGQNEVEIAYHTFSRLESRGYATSMAEAMFEIARKFASEVSCVVAHTLPENDASTSVLKKNSFVFAGELIEPDEGKLWRWIKPVEAGP